MNTLIDGTRLKDATLLPLVQFIGDTSIKTEAHSIFAMSVVSPVEKQSVEFVDLWHFN